MSAAAGVFTLNTTSMSSTAAAELAPSTMPSDLARRVRVPATDVRSTRGEVGRDPAAGFAQAEDGDAKTISKPASHRAEHCTPACNLEE